MGKHSNQATDTNDDTDNIERLSKQLNDATSQVLHNIMQMDQLHLQWVNYLLVLSFIVVLISTHQIYSNFDSNYKNIDHTIHSNHQLMLHIRTLPKPIQVLLRIDYSIITYIVSSCMSIFLFMYILDIKRLLQEQQPLSNSMTTIFRHLYFRLTQFCFLPTIALYYYHSKNKVTSIPLSTSSLSSSTIMQPQFPIVVIYFVIAIVCIWFMQHQAERMYRSYDALIRLKSELAKKEQEQQQSCSSGGKKKN